MPKLKNSFSPTKKDLKKLKRDVMAISGNTDDLPVLTDMQQVWLMEYVKDYKGPRAAGVAGYADIYKASRANKLSLAPHIRAYWAEKHLTKDEIAGRMADIARFQPADYIDKHGHVDRNKLSKDGYGAMIKEIESRPVRLEDGTMEIAYKVKFHDQSQALKEAAKWLGMNDQSVNVNIQTKGFSSVSPDDWDEVETIYSTSSLEEGEE